MLEAAIEAGADDCETGGDMHLITCGFTAVGEVSSGLAARFGEAASVRIVWRPHNLVPISGEPAQTLLKLLDVLDDLDDVQAVYSNADIPEAELAAWEEG